MSQNWFKLSEIRDYSPTSELGLMLDRPLRSLPLIGETPQSLDCFRCRDWFKVGPLQYVSTRDGKFTGIAWAASDGAFAYILTRDPYFDDGATGFPPPDMLPDSRSFSWESIVEIGRGSGDRFFRNVDFLSVREVGFGRHTFYYRHSMPALGETPICVCVVPVIEPRLVA